MDYIDSVFSKGGYLSALYPLYQPREGQIQIARAIDEAITKGVHVIAEGPTGVGKSFAYSVPATYHAAHFKKKVCIVTSNNNLQRQVYKKDLMEIQRAVPWKFKVAIRKGLNNYLCVRDLMDKRYESLKAPTDSLDLVKVRRFRQNIEDMREWADRTNTGDREESPCQFDGIWKAFSTSRDYCDGNSCKFIETCHPSWAKEKSADADVVITNYHLFFMHLKSGKKILPESDIVIFDEAHAAVEVARSVFGDEVTVGRIKNAVRDLPHMPLKAIEGDAVRKKLLSDLANVWPRLREGILSQPLDGMGKVLNGLEEASWLYDAVASAYEGELDKKHPNEAYVAYHRKYSRLRSRTVDLINALSSFVNQTVDNMVYVAEKDETTTILKSYQIDVSDKLRQLLFSDVPTVALVSATLATAGEGGVFDDIRKEIGMDKIRKSVTELVVRSPFNWAKQAIMVVPASMPNFKKDCPKWKAQVPVHFENVVKMMNGRTLGLFSTWEMLYAVRDRLRRSGKWTVFCQGEATNAELVQKFTKLPESILLGTESFSEGISVEGETCSCVVIDKIPFTHPDDPIAFGFKKKGKKDFWDLSLPNAIISMKQRIGRLIRTSSDTGMVVVLDNRILDSKVYSQRFIQSIPRMPIYRTFREAEGFLRVSRHKRSGAI